MVGWSVGWLTFVFPGNASSPLNGVYRSLFGLEDQNMGRRVGVDADAFYLLGEAAIRVTGQLDYDGWQADPLTQGDGPYALVALAWRRLDGIPLSILDYR